MKKTTFISVAICFAINTFAQTCLAPSTASVSQITSTSATFLWNIVNNAETWNIKYGVQGFAQGEATTTVTSSSEYALSELTANTIYDFYVQADCGSGDMSTWGGPFTFTTTCDAVTTFPWTEDFEDVTIPNLPSCWSENNYNSDEDFWVTTDGYGLASSAAFIDTYYNEGDTDDYLILPPFTLTGNERLKFSVKSIIPAGINEYRVVLSTSNTDPSSFDQTLMTLTQAPGTYTQQLIDLSDYSETVFIAIHVPANSLDGYALFVDDFTLETIPLCPEPVNLTDTNITTTSVNIGWTAGASEAAWNIEYGVSGFTQGDGSATTVAASENPYSLMDLTPNTNYDIYVQADCGTSGTSVWIGPLAIFTGYCVPSSSDASTFIDSVTTTGAPLNLNNGADGYTNNGYGDYFSTHAIQSLAGGSFDLTATIVGGTVGFSAWIDYDNNTMFDPSTEVVFSTESYGNGPFTTTITLPATLPDGDYRMRLIIDFEDEAPNEDACAFISTRAEAEDYKITVDSSLGIDAVSKSSFTYFPNPVSHVLSINASASIDGITIYNMLGQTVVRSTPNTTTTTVDMSGLQTGAYFVQVAINNSIETVRVIKN